MRLEPISKKSASAGSNSGDLALASAHRLSAAGVIKVCAPSQLSFSKSFFSSPLVKSRFSGWLSGALALYSLALPANNCLGNESVFEPGIALWASAWVGLQPLRRLTRRGQMREKRGFHLGLDSLAPAGEILLHSSSSSSASSSSEASVAKGRSISPSSTLT